jgi:glycopeptide antibiotics resistance protein
MVISIGLFLCPGPSFWYGLLHGVDASEGGLWSLLAVKFQVFLIYIEEGKEIKQVVVHFILMAICAFFLSKEVSLRIPARSVNLLGIIATTLLFILAISFFVEVIQSVLPISFARGFDWMDIGFSLLGGLLGGIIALVTVRE